MAVPLKGLIAPSNLVASNVTETALQLNWKDNSTSEKWFDVYLSTDFGTTWTFYSPSIPKNTTVAQITGLRPGTDYQFKVAAANGSKAAYSDPIQVTTLPLTPLPPASIPVGDYRVKSQYAVANSAGRSAFLITDVYGSTIFLVLYDRAGKLDVIPLSDLPGYKASLSAELQWVSDTRLVMVTSTRDGMLDVWEYEVSGTTATFVSSFEIGDGYCRWVDVIKLADGRIVSSCYEQAGGIEGWFLHRNTDGTWVNHGRQVMVASDPLGEPGGAMRMAQRPDGTLWCFGVKDSWSVLNAAEIVLDPFKVITNIPSIIPHSDYGQNIDITINGELPQFFKIAQDGDVLVFLYPNENLVSITTPPYAIRVAKLAFTSWNPDGTITLLENTPGYTERSYANFALNMVSGNPSICYVSLAYQNGGVPNLLTQFYQGAERVLMSLDHWTDVVENRDFNDVIGRSDAGMMQVMLLGS